MAQELERRDAASHTPDVRRVHIPAPLAELGVAMAESDGMRMIAIPPNVKERFNVLTPVQLVAQADPNFTPSVRVVQLDVGTLITNEKKGTSPHFFPTGGGKYAMTKQGLEVISQAAGIVESYATPIPASETLPGKDFGYRGTVKVRRSDGTIEVVTRERWWSRAEAREQVEDEVNALAARFPDDWNAERIQREIRKRWLFEQEHAPSKTESKAILRAIRAAISLPALSKAEIQKPFMVVGYQFTPDYSDPETKRILITAGLGAQAQLYPASAAAEPVEYARPDEVYEGFEGPELPEHEGRVETPAGANVPEPPADESGVGPTQSDRGAASSQGASESAPQPNPDDDIPFGSDEPLEDGGAPVDEPPPPGESAAAETAEQVADRAGAVEVTFGRHKGKTLSVVYGEDPNWFQWVTSEKFSPGEDRVRQRIKAAAAAYLNVHTIG